MLAEGPKTSWSWCVHPPVGRVQGLVSAHWWGSGGWVLGQLGCSGGPTASIGLLVGEAVSLRGCCLVWGAPGLVPTSWWAGLGPGTNELGEGLQNGSCQHQCPRGRRNSPNSCHQCLCPMGESQLPPASLGGFPRSDTRYYLSSFQITAFTLGLNM